MAPFKDERSDTLYIGVHTNLQGDSSYFKSHPFPLEKAIKESLSDALSRYGVKTIPIPNWDGKPESLKNMETDSVLMIEIKRFWTEGKASAFRTTMKTTVQFVIHLGVKKEGKVFTRNVEVEKEMTVARSTPEKVETMINQILDGYFRFLLFQSLLSNPQNLLPSREREKEWMPRGGKNDEDLFVDSFFNSHCCGHFRCSKFSRTSHYDKISHMEI